MEPRVTRNMNKSSGMERIVSYLQSPLKEFIMSKGHPKGIEKLVQQIEKYERHVVVELCSYRKPKPRSNPWRGWERRERKCYICKKQGHTAKKLLVQFIQRYNCKVRTNFSKSTFQQRGRQWLWPLGRATLWRGWWRSGRGKWYLFTIKASWNQLLFSTMLLLIIIHPYNSIYIYKCNDWDIALWTLLKWIGL